MENQNEINNDVELAKRYAMKSFFQKYILEITQSLFTLGVVISMVPSNDIFMQKACLYHLGFEETICKNLSAEKHKSFMADVQIVTKYYTTSRDAAMSICGAVASLIFGQYMAKYGVKIPLIVCFIGMLISSLAELYTFYYMSVPLIFSALIVIPCALTGSFIVLTTAIFTNITHSCPSDIRRFRFLVIQFFDFVPMLISMATGSAVYTRFGVLPLGVITLTFLFIALLMIIFYFEELAIFKEMKRTRFCERLRHSTSLNTFRESFLLIFKKRRSFGRVQLISMICCLLIGYAAFVGGQDIDYLYLNLVYNWDVEKYSAMSTIIMTGLFILAYPTMLFLTKVWKLNDPLLGALGYFCFSLKYFFSSIMHLGILMYYLQNVISLPCMVGESAIRSHISRLLLPNEVSVIFSLIASLQMIAPIGIQLLVAFIYSSSVKSFQGLAFTFLGFVCLIPVGLALMTAISMERQGVPKFDDEILCDQTPEYTIETYDGKFGHVENVIAKDTGTLKLLSGTSFASLYDAIMLIATALFALAGGDVPTAWIHGQQVTGRRTEFSYTSTVVDEFLGIPYAEPPIGGLRFTKPVPINYTRPINATAYAPGCMAQFGMFWNETKDFSEDCLYLNVWRTTGTNVNDSKAVVLVVHGGGYSAGDGSEHEYRGLALAAIGDVIVVNFNYRLGIFGFLDLGIEKAPGHQGHWDQVLVMKWVKQNIRSFGGDPERITLFGLSAGSMSVSAALMSRHTRGLFHAAILDGGVLDQSDSTEKSTKRATDIAESCNCLVETNEQVLACLLEQNATALVELQQQFAVSQTYTFRPTRHNDYLDESPADLLSTTSKVTNRVPIIIGDSAKEGTFLITENVHDSIQNLSDVEETVALIKKLIQWHNLDEALGDEVYLRETYDLVNGRDTYFYRNATADFMGDAVFVCPVNSFVQRYSQHSMVYHYFWRRTTVTPTVGDPWAFGAYHGIPFDHMIGLFFYIDNLDPEDVAYSYDTIVMLSEFAKTTKRPSFRGVSLPPFDAVNKRLLIFDYLPHITAGHPRAEYCKQMKKVLKDKAARLIDEL